jgi:hypothetical protein
MRPIDTVFSVVLTGLCLLSLCPVTAYADQIWLSCNISVSGTTFGSYGIPTDIKDLNGNDGRTWYDTLTYTQVLERDNPPKLYYYSNSALYPLNFNSYTSVAISWKSSYKDQEQNVRVMTITVDRATLSATVQRAQEDRYWQLGLAGSGTCKLINPLPVTNPKF